MDRSLIRYFWDCGDGQIIDYAVMRARLNFNERQTLRLMLDGCQTQEQAAESLDVSTRCLQAWWYSATDKLLAIPWVTAYARELKTAKEGQ